MKGRPAGGSLLVADAHDETARKWADSIASLTAPATINRSSDSAVDPVLFVPVGAVSSRVYENSIREDFSVPVGS